MYILTDGGYKDDLSKACIGIAFLNYRISKKVKAQSSNHAEMLAILYGFQIAELINEPVTIRTDSQGTIDFLAALQNPVSTKEHNRRIRRKPYLVDTATQIQVYLDQGDRHLEYYKNVGPAHKAATKYINKITALETHSAEIV